MLRYTLRVRDLVHGTTLFTEDEQKIVDHPFFQRLRQIRQNDVAFYVYPSLNTSRFEHVLGTCRVAGMMAESLTHSPRWKTYARELKAQTGIASREGFVELARLYALLHDIGHLPLSHLFEMAAAEFAKTPARTMEIIEKWTGKTGFKKLHEALGAVVAEQMLPDIALSGPLRGALARLMTEKEIPLNDPLYVVQRLMDSEIDADRIDFVQRDGLLAGGEYGHYDTRRLCDAVFLERDESGWLIAYSEKALTSMEALLLDRYRIYEWIHFHHRVVAMKMLVRHLVVSALERGIIAKEQFAPASAEAFTLRDDVWLWGVLRATEPRDDFMRMIQRAVFFREKRNMLTPWKTRPAYRRIMDQLETKARATGIHLSERPGLPGFYAAQLESQLSVRMLTFKVKFTPVGERRRILLYSESERKLTGKNLLEISKLVENLEAIWKGEPQEYVLLVGENAAARAKELTPEWVDFTAPWYRH